MNRVTILLAALALASSGCGSSSDGTGSQAVTIQFQAMVGDQVFVCGDTYGNLGADDSSLQISDFRFYVQDVELRNADGDYVAVELDTSNWQTENVALLDFEDGCADLGNEETNTAVTGTVPEGTYDGIRFAMGVPFTLNHENPAVAEPPLNLTAMEWNWQGGYKFLRIDSGAVSDTDWRMHLGSTGCDGDPVAGGTTTCSNPNRVAVELTSFDPATDTVVANFAALVDGAALDENQPDTPVGCMSDPTDGDCAPLFENLGLPFEGVPAGAQQFFSVE
ncbi:MAG: MbnP family copper-binding protein [Polyangiales bacterium]